MDLFDNLDQAEAFENSEHFATGRYVVRIEACKFKRAGHNGDSFIVETTVLGAIAEDGEVKQKDQTVKMVRYPRPGARASHVWGASGSPTKVEQGRGNWIAFLCAAFGCKKTDFDGPTWKAHSGQVLDNNYLKGQIFGLDCHVKRTKDDGPFTVHNWRGPADAERLAEFGLAADGSPLGGEPAATPAQAYTPAAVDPQYANDAAGKAMVTVDGGVSWKHVV